jgi:type II secretory pathway pseudopilin PulG
MRLSLSKNRAVIRAYTLVEALVAGAVLMIGVSAASQLTLTLITQDEMNQRASTAYSYLETAARLYQMGFDEAEILAIVPDDPIVDSLTVTPATPSVTGLGTIQSATLSVIFHPSPATESWTANIWSSGNKNATRTSTLTAYRSPLSSTVN